MRPDNPDQWPRKNESAHKFAVRDLPRRLASTSYKEATLTKEETTFIMDMVRRNEELPPVWRGKLWLFLRETRCSCGPNPMTLLGRNAAICVTMDKIVRFYGVAPTRNPGTAADSAASIVQKSLRKLGLKLSEQRINKIFLQFRQELREVG